MSHMLASTRSDRPVVDICHVCRCIARHRETKVIAHGHQRTHYTMAILHTSDEDEYDSWDSHKSGRSSAVKANRASTRVIDPSGKSNRASTQLIIAPSEKNSRVSTQVTARSGNN